MPRDGMAEVANTEEVAQAFPVFKPAPGSNQPDSHNVLA